MWGTTFMQRKKVELFMLYHGGESNLRNLIAKDLKATKGNSGYYKRNNTTDQ